MMRQCSSYLEICTTFFSVLDSMVRKYVPEARLLSLTTALLVPAESHCCWVKILPSFTASMRNNMRSAVTRITIMQMLSLTGLG